MTDTDAISLPELVRYLFRAPIHLELQSHLRPYGATKAMSYLGLFLRSSIRVCACLGQYYLIHSVRLTSLLIVGLHERALGLDTDQMSEYTHWTPMVARIPSALDLIAQGIDIYIDHSAPDPFWHSHGCHPVCALSHLFKEDSLTSTPIVSVLTGGDSAEREVSLVSGKGIIEAFQKLGTPAKIQLIENTEDLKRRLPEVEVAFSVLHGGDGEDGTVQRILEEHGIPYAGSGPKASRLGMDKLASKYVLRATGIPVPRALTFEEGDAAEFAAQVLRNFELPVVLKPLTQGASIGVKRIDTPKELVGSIESAKAQYGTIFIEEFIRGREFTVSILRLDGEDRALPIIEILVHSDFLDYEAKYSDDLCEMVVPANIDPETETLMKDVALKTHLALGCWGFSRVDILLSGDGVPYVLETNTLPGMTPHSALPKSAEAAGIDYPHLVDIMLQSAYTRPSKAQ
ncbi:D-alanine--D-alanine ligase [archaeon]|nr:MAG: D-alanine--D-alanine ligase [archaeon]